VVQASNQPMAAAASPTLTPLSTHTTVAVSGPYREVRHLGSGAGGAAFLARSSEGHEVVIKKVPLVCIDGAAGRAGAAAGDGRASEQHGTCVELQVMRALEPHPHIVHFYEAFEVASCGGGAPADELHIVMQYCAVRFCIPRACAGCCRPRASSRPRESPQRVHRRGARCKIASSVAKGPPRHALLLPARTSSAATVPRSRWVPRRRCGSLPSSRWRCSYCTPLGSCIET
jgi:hypothetical protein